MPRFAAGGLPSNANGSTLYSRGAGSPPSISPSSSTSQQCFCSQRHERRDGRQTGCTTGSTTGSSGRDGLFERAKTTRAGGCRGVLSTAIALGGVAKHMQSESRICESDRRPSGGEPASASVSSWWGSDSCSGSCPPSWTAQHTAVRR